MTLLFLWLAGCGASSDQARSAPVVPAAIEDAECAVCRMVVGEQPAPRGQVAHRDGTHAHFCSLGDLRAYLQDPGPRGQPVGVWVEGLEPSYEPAFFDTDPRPWIDADAAYYTVGFERPRVMGRPALSYRERAHAEAAAGRLGGKAVPWAALLETPFSEDP